jgi:hypothetical protein
MRTLHPVLVAICFLFVACAPQSGMEELRTELGAVSARLNAAEKKIAEFEVFKRAQQMQNGLRDANKVAFLTPADSGYATVATDIGTLTVSLENVQAYANGSKIALRWGNPMSASVEVSRRRSNGAPSMRAATSTMTTQNRRISPSRRHFGLERGPTHK